MSCGSLHGGCQTRWRNWWQIRWEHGVREELWTCHHPALTSIVCGKIFAFINDEYLVIITCSASLFLRGAWRCSRYVWRGGVIPHVWHMHQFKYCRCSRPCMIFFKAWHRCSHTTTNCNSWAIHVTKSWWLQLRGCKYHAWFEWVE
jgi:hypothetical protein